MSKVLDRLASDIRLHNLFGEDQYLTVTQVWVLEINRAGSAELRFLYGRSLPGTYESNSWAGTTSSKLPLYDDWFVRTHALTLHSSSRHLKIFLEQFLDGATLQDASQLARLDFNDKLAAKVGTTTFGANPIARPVMHLPTRGFFQFRTSRVSPTDYASVDSAAISSEGKPWLFSMPGGSDRIIAEAACRTLDADTGLDFTKLDAWRIGDFEFICAPSLTHAERSKYDISLRGTDSYIELFEPLTHQASDLLVVVNAYSEDSVQATYTVRFDKHASYPLKQRFTLEALQNQACTSFTLEIYAVGDISYLVLQTGNYFVRSINLNMQLVEPIRSNGKFSWLEKHVPPKQKSKVEAAGRVGRAIRPSRSQLGGHDLDPWVAINWATEETIRQLFPKPSKGRFFPKLTDSGGTSRLRLTDWLREIFESNYNAQIAWIDPFMEDVGIELLNRMGTSTGDYLIITTEKISNDDAKADVGQPSRIQRLLSQCEDWGNGYFGNVRLKVLVVPESKIHDRIILVRSESGRPLAGYHLSNSIQRANDKFPLLATPIPLDVLEPVFEYADQIIQSTLHADGGKAPTAEVIFDSATFEKMRKDDEEPLGLNHRSSFVEASRAGDVLAWWLNDPGFAGLSGVPLMNQLEAKGKVKDGELDPEIFDNVPPKFWTDGLPTEDFHSFWDAFGYVLAHTHAGQLYTKGVKPFPQALQTALLAHLQPCRAGALQPRKRNTLLDLEYYRSQDLSSLLLSPNVPHAVFRYSPVESSWSDYYALKLLWSHAPQVLVTFLSATCATPIKDLRAHALVNEAFKHICMCLGFDKNLVQLEALMHSETSIVTWVGLHAFKDAINNGTLGAEALSNIDKIAPASLHRTILCWLVNEANYVKSDIKPHLISKLTQSLQGPLSDQELQDILQPVRGRLGRLHHFTPWILESLLLPMLERKTIEAASICREWLNELKTQWHAALRKDSLYFTLEADGAFTDELAILTSYLATEDQESVVAELWRVFNTLARTIRKPLSSQVDWVSYIRAHEVNLWIYALARRIEALIDDETNESLAELLRESELIVDRFPYMESVASTELLTYMRGDPVQIIFHSLRHTIDAAITAVNKYRLE